MIEYQHNWETVESFNFSSLIIVEDQALAVKDIEDIIASGDWFKTSPKYQTQENLFARSSEHWLKFKHSFIMSCFLYLKQEVKIKNIQSWSFMTSNQTVENREALWHNHQLPNERTVSGIYYLQVPDDADLNTSGTEFAFDGPEQSTNHWTGPVKPFNWLIYPGKTWHRPTPPQSSQNRFIIAADMIF
jgi:hypothetical protein